jgi:hypothetical protein
VSSKRARLKNLLPPPSSHHARGASRAVITNTTRMSGRLFSRQGKTGAKVLIMGSSGKASNGTNFTGKQDLSGVDSDYDNQIPLKSTTAIKIDKGLFTASMIGAADGRPISSHLPRHPCKTQSSV